MMWRVGAFFLKHFGTLTMGVRMKEDLIFGKLRQLSGGRLTQAQVDATNRILMILGNDNDVAIMLGVVDEMKTSQVGLQLIKDFEGFRNYAYDDGVGVWTIGYGTTIYPDGRKVKRGDRCSLDEAEKFLRFDLKNFEDAVSNAVRVTLTQNQFDALVSFTYNVGAGALRSSTLLKKLNRGDMKGAAFEFEKWNKAGGKVMAGLTRRRLAERALFLK